MSEASDLLFKTIIFHVAPYGPQIFIQGFSDGGGEDGGVGGDGGGGSGAWTDDK